MWETPTRAVKLNKESYSESRHAAPSSSSRSIKSNRINGNRLIAAKFEQRWSKVNLNDHDYWRDRCQNWSWRCCLFCFVCVVFELSARRLLPLKSCRLTAGSLQLNARLAFRLLFLRLLLLLLLLCLSVPFCCVAISRDIDMMAQTHGQLQLVKESNCEQKNYSLGRD